MANFATSQTVTVESPVEFYARPSAKNDDTIVVGLEANGERRRVALLRVEDGAVKIRTLDGNPRERSSQEDGTQRVFRVDLDELTDDAVPA